MVADPQECRDFLAAHPHVRFVEVFFTSMTGVPRGKRLRAHETRFFEVVTALDYDWYLRNA